ncbi:uncharacterized protein [Pempheris klunzingeri]|uniref:uncharacterized protein n=1 Tax=Pempheris klunzingeri TaxID=3127111 RepID=UPI003980E47D
MFRFSLMVAVSLIVVITAKPYKPWSKHTGETFKDTVLSVDDKGKMSWGVEVEPPEDMDETDYDIDPRMMIWKNMAGGGRDKGPPKAEEDLDELHHPSMADLLRVQIQNLDAHNQEPEEDKDDTDHPVFSQVAAEEPEQDWDEVYHKASEELAGYLAPLLAEYKTGAEVRVAHSEPERDEDDLYHKDLPEPIPYQDDPEAAAPVYVPSQRKYSEPEEDLDDLYHR